MTSFFLVLWFEVNTIILAMIGISTLLAVVAGLLRKRTE